MVIWPSLLRIIRVSPTANRDIFIYLYFVDFLVHSTIRCYIFWNMAGAGIILVLHRRYGRYSYSSLIIQVVLYTCIMYQINTYRLHR